MIQFCEVCFRQPKTPGALFLSSCRHMFCRSCGIGPGQCSVCKAPCRTVEIRSETLPDDLKDYFVPAEKLLTKALKVAQFQQGKQDAFIAGLLELKLRKYETKKKSIEKLKKHYDSLNSTVKKERLLIRKLREKRKSPGTLTASPNSPLWICSQKDALWSIAQAKDGSPRTPQHPNSGVSSGSRWSALASQRCSMSQSSSSSSGGSIGSMRRPTVATFKKPADLVKTAKAGIYEQAVRNIDRAMQRPSESVLKANRRKSDIDRARNGKF